MTAATGPTRAEVALAATRSLADYRLRPPGFVPQPHQIAPPGDWYGWLMNAGRGSGKTRAASNWIIEHVKGPACLPGPTPHWIGIIAPTLGDAVTACVSGPSGIATHDPTAKLSGGAGGLFVKWNNGSRAKLFGASSPEDVERLRAGGNTCLVANTLVSTTRGDVRIADVRVGDYVWTRRGVQCVLRSGQTGVRSTLLVVTEQGRQLELTPNHELFVNGEWRAAEFLKPGDALSTCDPTWCMTASVGISEKTDTTPTQNEDYFTDTCGNNITAQSHVAMTFTTCLTVIEQRQTSLVSKCSHIENTHASTRDVTTQVIHAPVKQCGKNALHAKLSVNDVALKSPLEALDSSIAPRVMTHDTSKAKFPVVHVKNGCAWCAKVGSQPPSAPQPELAHDRVLHVSQGTRDVPVYDLLVEHDHEFFANGILVSNCAVWCEELAAWRYLQECYEQMRFGLRTGPTPRWIASTTPKPKPLIKKLVKNTPHNVVVTHATTNDNPHLEQFIRDALFEEYADRDIGRQELYAAIMEQDEAALWRRDDLEQFRVVEAPPLAKVSVGVDPSGGAGEQGIVVAGKHVYDDLTNGQRRKKFEGYVLDDRTCHLGPAGWGRRAVQAAIDWEADDIVVETNFGGQMAVVTIRDAAEALGVTIPVKEVVASRGKRVRAEPVAALSSRGQWHHVGFFEQLEDQLCTWTEDLGYSPDRLDAMVWVPWYQRIVSTRPRGVGSWPAGGSMTRSIG